MSDTNTPEPTPNPVPEAPGNPSVEPFGKTDSSFQGYTPSVTNIPPVPPSYPAVSSQDAPHLPAASTAAPYQYPQPPNNWFSQGGWQQDNATAPAPISIGPHPGDTWWQHRQSQGPYAPPPATPALSTLADTGYGHDPDDMSKPLYGATFGQAVIRFFSRYARFKGYSSKSEFWWVYLFDCVVGAAFAFLLFLSFMPILGSVEFEERANEAAIRAGAPDAMVPMMLIGLCMFAYWLGTLVPRVALTVRRLRDTGRDWPWIFVAFVPYIGGILLMILCALDTDMSQHRPEWEDTPKVPNSQMSMPGRVA
mgnify:CR=1 FL=1